VGLGELEIPAAPGLEVRRLGHGERRRQAREQIPVVLSIGHALGAHEALPYPGPARELGREHPKVRLSATLKIAKWCLWVRFEHS
jgi:hypothetical protein